MEAINNNDNAPTIRSTINNNFSSMGSGFQEIYETDNAPTFIGKVNHNFEVAEQGGGGSGETIVVNGAINVKTHYNAVGDGVADDTAALEAAFAAAATSKRPIYIPAGTYLIRRALKLVSGMEIFGDGDTSVIKKKPAVWSTLSAATEIGDETIYLTSVNGFNVGDHFYISSDPSVTYNGSEGARTCSYGIITAVNTSNNSITFESLVTYAQNSSKKKGTVKAHKVNCVASTSHALLRAWSSDECCNVVIRNLKLDGNRQTGEPICWCNSAIHFEPYQSNNYSVGNGVVIYYKERSYNHTIDNCTIVNASADAISDQGEGGLIVQNCTIGNNAMHGVHAGTTFSGGFVFNCTMTGNGTRGAGVFWCQNVTNVAVINNSISGFNHGCSDMEYGSPGKDSVIKGNTFTNIKSAVFDFTWASSQGAGGGLSIINNTINQLKGMLLNCDYSDNIELCWNTIASITTTPSTLITCTSCRGVVIVGNTLPTGTTISTPVNSNNTTNIINASNSWNV